MSRIMKGILSFLLVVGICSVPTFVTYGGEEIIIPTKMEESEKPIIQPRQSRIVVIKNWELGRKDCVFALTFIGNATGSGTITLQQKSGSTWKDIRSLSISFKDAKTVEGVLAPFDLLSGTYRLKADLKATLLGASQTEIIYFDNIILN